MKKDLNILEALLEAQKIAFAPFVFQASITAKKLGIFGLLAKCPSNEVEISKSCNISIYGVKVIAELLLCANVLTHKDGKYALSKIGECLHFDAMSDVNMDFTADVCYQGLYYLTECIKQSKPLGLKMLGDWESIYPHLSELPNDARQSWFKFDHFYSDRAFSDCVAFLSKQFNPKMLFDIGGNTGKFAAVALKNMEHLHLVLIDLKEQCHLANKNPELAPYKSRFGTASVNWLDKNAMPQFDGESVLADIIFMSQFLDCFSNDEAESILTRAKRLLNKGGKIAILECFYDVQKHEAAALSIAATSAYFTTMANGNSRFFTSSELKQIITKSGLKIIYEIDNIGISHTLLVCEPM